MKYKFIPKRPSQHWLLSKDYTNSFPELKPLINVKLSGLYLTITYRCLAKDL